jgi:hypothetical protein
MRIRKIPEVRRHRSEYRRQITGGGSQRIDDYGQKRRMRNWRKMKGGGKLMGFRGLQVRAIHIE